MQCVGNGHSASPSSDIRASGPIVDRFDFVILEKILLASRGSLVQSDVSVNALSARAAKCPQTNRVCQCAAWLLGNSSSKKGWFHAARLLGNDLSRVAPCATQSGENGQTKSR
jgi:hypothetical protein